MSKPTDPANHEELMEVLRSLVRAAEELGFNGALTRLRDRPEQGIGESMIVEMRRIANALEVIADLLRNSQR